MQFNYPQILQGYFKKVDKSIEASLFLNELVEIALTTLSGREFHGLMTRLAKKLYLMELLTNGISSLRLWPRVRLEFENLKKSENWSDEKTVNDIEAGDQVSHKAADGSSDWICNFCEAFNVCEIAKTWKAFSEGSLHWLNFVIEAYQGRGPDRRSVFE